MKPKKIQHHLYRPCLSLDIAAQSLLSIFFDEPYHAPATATGRCLMLAESQRHRAKYSIGLILVQGKRWLLAAITELDEEKLLGMS